jgi:hypothetical protein
MKITKRQLNKILLEEAQIANIDRINLNENLGDKALSLGNQILMQMLKSGSGRKKLSSICYALPDFVKKTICDMPEGIVEKIANKADVSQNSMLRKIPGGLTIAWKYVCRLNVTVIMMPLYVAGFILEALTDEDVEALTKTPDQPIPEVPTPPELTGPDEEDDDDENSIAYGGLFLDQDELDDVLEEVKKRINFKK